MLYRRERGQRILRKDDQVDTDDGARGERPEVRLTTLLEEDASHGDAEHGLQHVEQVHLILDIEIRRSMRGERIAERLREEHVAKACAPTAMMTMAIH
jgi:hypothetical protein